MMTEKEISALLAEVERLRSKNALLESEVESLNTEKTSLVNKVESLNDHISSLENQLFWLRKKVFGKMSEKQLPLDPAQLSLFEKEGMSAEDKANLNKIVEEAEKQITKTITVKEKPARKPLDTSKLPVREINIYPEGTTNEDGILKDEYVEIGTEETCRLERIPASVFIEKIIRHKVISKSDISDKHPEERTILTPALPLAPISKCIAGASVLSDIIVGKFVYHLPFYRLIQQYKESGITISDSTMGGWYEAAVEKLKLLYDRLRKQIMSSEYIQIDESVIPVIDNEKHMARKGYEWCVRDGITGDVMFYYDRGTREYAVAREILGNYKGNVQSDGYGAYDQFENYPDITMYGCWCHARRYFVNALDENNVIATQGICYIRQLYKVESEADEQQLSPEARKEKRLKEAYPVIQAFERWMMDTWAKVSPKSRCGSAIAYTYALLPRLSRYVNNGRINIDNNLIENAVRPLAIGRKNYLFCGNDASAYRAAIVYSLIGTCKAAGVDPRIWLEDVLKKLPYYERDGRNLDELLPRTWAKSNQTVTK